jgi:hypothetical protein
MRSASTASTCSTASCSLPPQRISLIPFDLDEFLHRLLLHPFGSGMDEWFQSAFTLTALDRRPFAPPIESARDRVTNMRNACDRFGVSPGTVDKLEAAGFASCTILALISVERLVSLRLVKKDHLAMCSLVQTLNGSPLEPLYSLKKYAQKKRSNEKRKKMADEEDKGSDAAALSGLDWLNLHYKASPLQSSSESSNQQNGGPPQKRPSTTSSTLKYLAVVSFYPEDVGKAVVKSPALLPPPPLFPVSAVKRRSSLVRRPSSSSTSSTPQPKYCDRKNSYRSPTSSPPPPQQQQQQQQHWAISPTVNGVFKKMFAERPPPPTESKQPPSCAYCMRPIGERHAHKGRRFCSTCYFNSRNNHIFTDQYNGGCVTPDLKESSSPLQNSRVCRNENHGCPNVLSLIEMKQHERHCDYNPLYCPWNGCNFFGNLFECSRHLEQAHKRVLIDALRDKIYR